MRIAVQIPLFAVMAAFLGGCLAESGLEVGPFPIVVPVDGGAIDPAGLDVPAGTTGTVTMPPIPLCDLPSEEEVNEMVAESTDEITSSFFTVSEIAARELVLTAVDGDFGAITRVRLFYQEPSTGILPAQPTFVAESSSPAGFDMEIVLVPQFDVNLLDVIRARDKDPDAPCPNLLLEITGEKPDETIVWQADLYADIYGRVGI